MTTENQTEEPEVIEETPQETQQVTEGEAEVARANFQKRQQKQKQDAERLKQENEYLRTLVNQQPQRQQQAPQQPQVSDMPQLENFETEGEWINAVLDAREQKRVVKQQIDAKTQTYTQKLDEYAKVNKDIYAYEEEAVRVIGGNSVVADAIMRSEKAPLIVEAIALDPSKAEQLNRARDPYSLAQSILALEGSVGETPAFSDAPPARDTPKGETVISTKVDLSKLSKADYIAHRQKQRNK